ncbi:uncharacterized protein LOC131633128 [Vicia villosa]|uniref:uncharacterized protein LOC131633128 n=1 Tax=Vicia villosa TaxID=3911 RepID=UPI00273C0209|nr:uncharacterized protein LOC131633128 [Vicia villosa]
MIIFSLNLRRGGSRAKRKRVGYHIQRGDVDICFIQETKLSGIDTNLVKDMWGGDQVEWSYLDAYGASGGILTIWKKKTCSLSIIALEERGGDFNSISSFEERIGVSNRSYRREINIFNEFIEDMDLVDLPTIGGKFTWINSNGKTMSQIDRFLLLESFIEDWKVDSQYIGERDVSDHAPIWLKDNRKDWGPKPFKFNNMWFKHEEFDSFVEEEWNKIQVKGRGDYCLVEKLKTLKNRIS